MSVKVILVGGFSEIIECCEECDYSIVGIIDNALEKNILGYPVLGTDADATGIFNEFANIPLIVSPDLPRIRRKLVTYYKGLGFAFQTLVSPRATISKYASLGEGVIIHQGANVSAMTVISSFVRINVNGNVMHDCTVGAFTTIAPNGVLLGHVKIGEEVYVGANATILPSTTVSNFAVVGAGAVVTKNVEAHKTVKGVPAK